MKTIPVQSLRYILFSVVALMVSAALMPVRAQVVTATIPTGVDPASIALNATTNKIYVVNKCGNCQNAATVTVIDGATNSTSTVTVGYQPLSIAVNAVANKIYVVNNCGSDPNCASAGTVTIIDGATNNTSTVTTGYYPFGVALNSSTNKIYVTNYCGSSINCQNPGTVTVIDGSTNGTSSVTVGYHPEAIAVNPVSNKIYAVNLCGSSLSCPTGTTTVIDANNNNSTSTVTVGVHAYYLDINTATNKIYVSNKCGADPTCSSSGSVTVIDGATNGTVLVPVGDFPNGVAVNSTTNKIYVANGCGSDLSCNSPGSVTVIDGSTNNTSTIGVAVSPYVVAADTTHNKVYVTDFCGNDQTCQSAGLVTAIDGASGSTVPVAVGNGPAGLAVDTPTNTVYVPNSLDNTVSVIGASTTLQLMTMTPCRLVDTRNGSPIQGQTYQTFNLPQLAQQNSCGSLATAASFSLNVTLVPKNGHPVGYLTIWPAGLTRPSISTMNSSDGRTKADAAIVSAGASGGVNVYVTDTADVILDIDGYFTPSNSSTLAFYPLTPCRVIDTRGGNYLVGGVARDFAVSQSACLNGVNATAYSLNLTALPYPTLGSPLRYLEVWPTGDEPQNPVSTLNNKTGTRVANAAIVPAGTGGDITIFASDNTDLLIDINGYFAPAGPNGLSLYPTAPCRVFDTRSIGSGQPFSGTLSPPVDVTNSPCALPTTAGAYVFNATVVPYGSLGYLTLWPDTEPMPNVSTLNAVDGLITSNMAVVPNAGDGKVDAYAAGRTQLILDLSSYFAP
ncbi:MAG TPA: hypothetical protein VK976_13590 [Verrucomicrobiae bacterium]|jgi:DNA-binding beta-propeller fold protein YncE|nr:hypothetical protein [Verrucomicrobiae bacterium]